MKKTIKIILFPFTLILSLFSLIIKREAHIWVFGAQGNRFTDNTKHLYIHTLENYTQINAYWITSNRSLINRIKANKGKALYRWSIKGIYITLKAKYWFVTTTIGEINTYTSKGATVVNLWHGLPLKKIYFDSDNEGDYKRFHNPSFLQKYIFEPFTYRLSDYVISTSNNILRDSFSTALKCNISNCKPLGQPRTDILFKSETQIKTFITKWEDKEYIELYSSILKYTKVWLYMPTWRDHKPNFMEDIKLDYDTLNEILQNKNEVLLLKLHPYTPTKFLETIDNYSNIILIDTTYDIYPVLSIADVLITDYSSIYLDYLLLYKPIVFFIFDYEDYTSRARGLYYNFEDYTPGIKVTSPTELIELINRSYQIELDSEDLKEKRKQLTKYFYDHPDGDASNRIINFLLPFRLE